MVTRRSWIRAGLVLILVLIHQPARADWAVKDLTREAGPGGVIEYRRYSLGESASGDAADLQLALFSGKNATIRVIDQPASDRSLAETMSRGDFVAGVNGGYFDPAGAPVGLLRSNGLTIAPFRRARLLSGVLAAGSGGVKIFRASEFPAKHSWSEAVQCGPFLVDRGKPVAGLDDTRSARRTFVLSGSDGRAALGNCESATLAGLAQILTALSEIKVARALNLDGGSSSAFWCRTASKTISVPEGKYVRDFVVVGPRPTR